MSQEMDVTVFAAPPPEQFPNQHPKSIYPSSPIRVNNASLDKGPNHKFTSPGIMTRSNSGLGCRPGKNNICQKKNVSQKSATTETLAAACQKIEVEQKCAERRKRRENASVWRENASIPDKNYNKDERAKIVAEERNKRRMADLEHHIQKFKAKAYNKSSNDQRFINTCQGKVDILKEMMEAELEDRWQKMHCLE